MERRLAACLHADASGYCRLITADVQSTIRTVTAYQALMASLVAKHGGRVVDTAGDSLLAEFASASDALECAVEIQRELERHNAELPPARRLEFRLGIDLGEILAEGGRIYGDCVNIAARVQQTAAPGSICIAGSAYDHIGTGLPLRYDYLGERVLKNFHKPLRIYHVDWRPGSPVVGLTTGRSTNGVVS